MADIPDEAASSVGFDRGVPSILKNERVAEPVKFAKQILDLFAIRAGTWSCSWGEEKMKRRDLSMGAGIISGASALQLTRSVLVLAAAAFVAGCGGGGGGAPAAPILPAPDSDLYPNYGEAADNNFQISMINPIGAYQRNYFGQGVTVAVMDSGLRSSHEAFSGGVVEGRSSSNSGDTVSDLVVVNVGTNNDADGHGTVVAGIIAAARTITVSGSPADPDMHGVAPQAKIMPLKFLDPPNSSGNPIALFEYALSENVQIVNNSWGPGAPTLNVEYTHSDGSTTSNFKWLPPQIPSYYDGIVSVFAEQGIDFDNTGEETVSTYDDLISEKASKDVVFVWAAGNNHWNSLNGCVLVQAQNADDPPECIADPENTSENLTFEKFGSSELVSLEQNSGPDLIFTMSQQVSDLDLALDGVVGVGANLPHYASSVLGQNIAVVAARTLSPGVTDVELANFSNGCGPIAKNWCLTAPGTDFDAPDYDAGDGDYSFGPDGTSGWHGTSFAAPMVSGGLALLRSHEPTMPMSVIVAIVLRSADDLGDRGVDDVYGQGMLNVGNALTVQARAAVNMSSSSAGSSITSSALLSDSRASLSSALRGLGHNAAGLSLAVSYLDDYYYEMPLSGLFDQDHSRFDHGLGHAASGMMIDAGEMGLAEGFSLRRDANGEVGMLSLKRGRAALDYTLCEHCARTIADRYSLSGSSAPFFTSSDRRLHGSWEAGQGDFGELQAFAASGLDENQRSGGYSQYGLRWNSLELGGAWRFAAEYSGILESQGFLLGGEFGGGLDVEGVRSRQLDLRFEWQMDGWRLFGAAEQGWTSAAGMQSSLVSEIDARYLGWRLGAEGSSRLRTGDRLLFGVTAQPRVTEGQMSLLLPRITGSTTYDADLLLDIPDEVGFEGQSLDMSSASAISFDLGYFAPLGSRKTSLATGVEYVTGKGITDEAALSFEFNWEF